MNCQSSLYNISSIEDLAKDSRISEEKNEIYSKCVDYLIHEKPDSLEEYKKCIRKIQKKFKICPKKSNLLNELKKRDSNFREHFLFQYLVKKRGKSASGVLVITVLTSPYPINEKGKKQKFTCKWNCYYCPAEPGQPRSYLHDEPAVLRANRNEFCPIEQFYDRANTLEMNGHPVDKIELLVLGGTWSSYPKIYQEQFCRDLYYAANTFQNKYSRVKYPLQKEKFINESAKTKIIGLTLETRPDCITADELRRFRYFGCTRVQIGVQHINNDILKKINRGHGIEESIRAVKLLLDNCFKVDIHLMPDLPGSSYEIDRGMFSYVLYSENLRADQLKIYPHSVVPWTMTKKWFDEGSYIPMKQDDLVELLIWFKTRVHPWIRLNRIIRDIPNQYISGGNEITNMRQVLQKKMKDRHLHCQCIRCREIGNSKITVQPELVVREYNASHGKEFFISFEIYPNDKDKNKLLGFIRLRISGNPGYVDTDCVFPSLKNCALIRELHVYGQLKSTNIDMKKGKDHVQHKGYGRKLLFEAEKIAYGHNFQKIAVIAGVGTRNYYRKYGYRIRGQGEFLVKRFTFYDKYMMIWNSQKRKKILILFQEYIVCLISILMIHILYIIVNNHVHHQ